MRWPLLPLLTSVLLLPLVLPGCGGGGTSPSDDRGELQLIFASRRSGNDEIWRMPLDGGDAVQLTDDDARETWWPRPSPDGTRFLAYRSPAPGSSVDYDNASLWVFDIDGANGRELLAKGAHGWTAQGVADWHPDGTQLVMAAMSQGFWHLFVSDAEGASPMQITSRQGLFLDPSWSPDGSRIVYCAYPPDYVGLDLARLEIHTCAADGSDERRLTYDTDRDHDPYWSPDGTQIAWESGNAELSGSVRLRLVAPDGTGLRTLVDDGHINTLPRWSADSRRVYFHHLDYDEILKGWQAIELDVETDARRVIELLAHSVDLYR